MAKRLSQNRARAISHEAESCPCRGRESGGSTGKTELRKLGNSSESRPLRTPTQPQSYLMGKIEILSIVEEYKRAHPKSGLREMHDAILGCGSLPPRLMRERLFAAKK